MHRYIPWQFVGAKNKKQDREECTGASWILADSAILQYKVQEKQPLQSLLELENRQQTSFPTTPANCDEIPFMDPNKKFHVPSTEKWMRIVPIVSNINNNLVETNYKFHFHILIIFTNISLIIC